MLRMSKRVLLGLLLNVFATIAYATYTSPMGEWQTIDDVTHRPKAIVNIAKSSNQYLFGRIVRLYIPPRYDDEARCKACGGARHNQPIIGMVVLDHVKQQGPNLWGGGHILDPQNGRTYHVSLQLAEGGTKLNVHGYIGLPLLGRTQIWNRLR